MSLINVQNLTFAYDGSDKNVFENVSFQLDTNWKLGLTGRNGRGKTTFLRLLAGEYSYRGTIASSVAFTYFPFPVRNADQPVCDVLSDICPQAQEWEIIREFSRLQLTADALYRPFNTLSGGEQTKALLAGLFLNDGNFLLIDEPTDHLDLTARKTVAQYLKSKKSYILVSHDRTFLDGCVDHILSINRANIEVQSGNFSSWLQNFERRQAFESAQNDKLEKEIAKLRETAKRTATWADKTEQSKFGKADSGLKQDRGYVGHKAAKMMQRAKVTQARQTRAAKQKSALLKNVETTDALKLQPLAYRAERLLSFSQTVIYYDNRPVCKPVTFELTRGSRIALDGTNGCGKSSILKLVARQNISHAGTFTLSSGVIVSYVPQTQENVRGTVSAFAAEHGVNETLLRAILHKTGLNESDCEQDLSAFSRGQKKKLFLAKSLCEQAHLYLWDEPLDFLDVFARMQIEKLLLQFCPTMLFVEHDEAFRNAVATQTVVMQRADSD